MSRREGDDARGQNRQDLDKVRGQDGNLNGNTAAKNETIGYHSIKSKSIFDKRIDTRRFNKDQNGSKLVGGQNRGPKIERQEGIFKTELIASENEEE